MSNVANIISFPDLLFKSIDDKAIDQMNNLSFLVKIDIIDYIRTRINVLGLLGVLNGDNPHGMYTKLSKI